VIPLISALGAAALVVLPALEAAAFDDCPKKPEKCAVFTAMIENDLFARHNTDRHYTNGLRIGLLSSEDWAEKRLGEASELLGVPLFEAGTSQRLGVALGHNIYTPEDKRRRDAILNDRPYAGWLYFGFALQSETPSRKAQRDAREGLTVRRLDTLELDLGVVGPAAAGERVQNDWHRLIGVDPAQGWSNQLRNEPGVALVFERKWQFLKSVPTWRYMGIDAIPHVSGSVGNVYTYAGAGAMFRIGENLTADFGPPRIRPALPGSGAFDSPDRFAWYLFFGGEGRAVARDITLDGNTFVDSRSVAKKALVGDLQVGGALIFTYMRVSYTQIMRTPEFEGQSRPDFFGSLSVAFRL